MNPATVLNAGCRDHRPEVYRYAGGSFELLPGDFLSCRYPGRRTCQSVRLAEHMEKVP
jgi:hypothetical protein